MLAYALIGVGVLLLAFYLYTRLNSQPSAGNPSPPQQQPTLSSSSDPPKQEEKQSKGRVRIYFGSQTGTAAKLSEQLAEEATENGFEPEVVDLDVVKPQLFDATHQISLFLLSNTGEGDPPQNTVKWMKALKDQQPLSEEAEMDWKNVNFSVFGLGSTQYQNYNTTGINCDELLAKKGANRIYQLGLGDDNCSLEDDFTEWRKELWTVLSSWRKDHPLIEKHREQVTMRKSSSCHVDELDYVSKGPGQLANFKLFLKRKDEEDYEWREEDLDFKTKISLKAEQSKVKSVRQLRQDEKDGSTLELEVQLPKQPFYATAANLAIYSKNDPKIVKEVVDYFGLSEEALDRKVGISKADENKKVKLNFAPDSLRFLLEDSIDLQGKVAKSTLKKLGKFPSSNPAYFADNSNIKTTDEFKRITDEKEWYYLIRLIREYQVKLTLEDFIELSDSMAPRLFTIASHYHAQNNVIVAASLVPNGLVSKFFLSKPKTLRAELRKSTFTDAMKWKKVIFMAAGTGLAPFRGYLQEKQGLVEAKKEAPLVTLFFGCKHLTGDYIYKEEINNWHKTGVINRLHHAFSRDGPKKVYIQDLLAQEEAELRELELSEDEAIYVCGSLPMGHSIMEVLTNKFGAEKVKEMEEKGRIVKELW